MTVPINTTINNREMKSKISYNDLDFGLLCVSFQIDNAYANALICIGSKYDTKLLAFCGSNISREDWDPTTKTLSCILEAGNSRIQLQKALLIQ